MVGIKKNSLVIISDTFPLGRGETFLEEEIKYVAKEFDSIVVFPLFNHGFHKERNLPNNVSVKNPLITTTDKDRWGLIRRGVFCYAPFFSFKEFWKRCLLGKNIALLEFQKKGNILKRIRIFFNYLLIYRSILGNSTTWNNLINECALSDLVYFYWGDKGALITPKLKKQLLDKCTIPPKIVVRFHGSDVYEGAKGYLPNREDIYSATDIGVASCKKVENYIRTNYRHQPSQLITCYLGSTHHDDNFTNNKKWNAPAEKERQEIFRIVSCSNVIKLKRIDLIFDSIAAIIKGNSMEDKLYDFGYRKIEWKHFGGGKELSDLKEYTRKELLSLKDKKIEFDVDFCGYTPIEKILNYYTTNFVDLAILLSKSEAAPLSLQEAISFGIPIVATDVGGIREIYESSNDRIGFITSPHPHKEEIAQIVFDFMMLKPDVRNNISHSAYLCWKNHWDASINYTNFSLFLKSQIE